MVEEKTEGEALRAEPVAWYYSPAAVLVALFVVLGPLALPLLWKSPRFTVAAKVGLTVIVCTYTAVVCWACVRIIGIELAHYRELSEMSEMY
jgi:hypothetical protein